MEKYNPQKIERKWQKKWEENPSFQGIGEKSDKGKFYCLDMFPYPSGDGLHMGHVESYTATDIISRYFRMKGLNVLHPQGWDAFGLPAENYAIKTKTHPSITTKKAIETFKRQMDGMGFSYDWSSELNSSDPEYYRWTQWFFLLLYKNGLAYKKKAKVNWCPKCQTVLANEQAEGGICERCEAEVIQRDLEQWFFKITDFAEDLLSGLDNLDWPGSTIAAQKNWIGKSEGVLIKFPISNFQFPIKSQNSNNQNFIEVYTTRVDTIYGCTYCVLAPENPIIEKLKDKIKNYEKIEKYIADARRKTELERTALQKDKTGVELQGIKVSNPFTKENIPLFVGDYVLGHYGTGAVMAVPAHDERDWEFAKKYNLPIKEVIAPYLKDNPNADKDTEKRDVATAIVRNPKDNTYLCLNWKTTNWKSFPTGGIDEEGLAEAAKREVEEETGYKNLKFMKQIGNSVYAEFYRPHKDSNVFAHFKYLLFELENDEKAIVKEKEKNQHEAVWIKEEDVDSFINVWNQKLIWKKYKEGNFAYCDDGILIDSQGYSGLTSEKAREKMSDWLEKEKIGKKKINYKLRDWLVSRQRYWGAPIPIIYCDKCGEIPVPEKDLPIELPDDVDFRPTGESPLIYSKKFQDVRCPKCGGKARRESDTMDTFVCSSWYYFRYTDPKNKKEFASKEQIKKWLPVDLYLGGAEHTVLHLLYARFFTKVLNKLGHIDFNEPFLKLRHQGIILASDGNKMSKSKGNVVNPDEVVKEFGADSLRLFEMFMGPLEDAKPWNSQGIIGTKRFLDKIWDYFSIYKEEIINNPNITSGGDRYVALLNKTIKKVKEDIESFRFNTAISQIMILLNNLRKFNEDREKNELGVNYTFFDKKEDMEKILILLSPFAPHIAEELWEKLGHKESIFKEKWPEYDSALVKDEEIELVIQINGKLRDRIKVPADISEEEAKKIATESEKVKNFIGDKKIKKTIFVKGKLINVVI